MYGIVRIDGADIEMRASAATPYRYKQIFHEDLLKRSQEIGEDGVAGVDFAQKIGYVMAMQASGADMRKLNEESFIDWCEQFSFNGMLEAVNDIIEIYAGNSATDSESKKNPDQPSES